jgi:phosphocarrier protein HPr
MTQLSRTFIIKNDKGLHARAAALLVTAAARYNATVTLRRENLIAECDSILSVLTLACPKNSQITVEVHGEEADGAMREIGNLIEDGFGENGNER